MVGFLLEREMAISEGRERVSSLNSAKTQRDKNDLFTLARVG
jgi:hypothetical protein